MKSRKDGENWSGEASRNGGLRFEEQQVGITIGDAVAKKAEAPKEIPVWLSKSTVISDDVADSNDSASGPGMFPDEVITTHQFLGIWNLFVINTFFFVSWWWPGGFAQPE